MTVDRLKVQKTTNITVFLGAGASAPFGCPTTKVFLERLGQKLGPSEKEWSYLNSIRNLYWVRDIEDVVELLDLILKIDNEVNESSLNNFFYRYPRSIDFGKRTERTIHTPIPEGLLPWTQLVELSSKLRDTIEDFVFKQYESDFSQYAQILQVMGSFFSVLKKYDSGKKTFEVFTTNYDNVVEDYCSEAGYVCSLSEVNHEQQPRVGAVSDEKFMLTKLHGALNWLVNKQTKKIRVIEAQTRVPKDSKSWDLNEYVLFGTKTRLDEAEIYSRLFKRFEKRLTDTSICVVVGFSFRDFDINKIFTDALETNKTLRILVVSSSPVNSLMNLVKSRRKLRDLRAEKRVFRLQCKFGLDKSGIEKAAPAIDNILRSM